MNTLLKDIVGGLGPPQEDSWTISNIYTFLSFGVIVIGVVAIIIYFIFLFKKK